MAICQSRSWAAPPALSRLLASAGACSSRYTCLPTCRTGMLGLRDCVRGRVAERGARPDSKPVPLQFHFREPVDQRRSRYLPSPHPKAPDARTIRNRAQQIYQSEPVSGSNAGRLSSDRCDIPACHRLLDATAGLAGCRGGHHRSAPKRRQNPFRPRLWRCHRYLCRVGRGIGPEPLPIQDQKMVAVILQPDNRSAALPTTRGAIPAANRSNAALPLVR